MTKVPIAQRVLYEDNHLIIINKLPGELAQGDDTGDITLGDEVRAYLKKKYNKPGNVFLGIPHRLDRPTSGVVVFARTEKALIRLNELFQSGTVEKQYWAVVDTMPPQEKGTLVHYLSRDTKKNKSTATLGERKNSKLAKLSYEVIGASKNFYLLDIKLITGRHHQIRAQLAAVGCHIKGDLKYGYPRSNPEGGIHLHARSISFMHPVKKEPVSVIAPTPEKDALWEYFNVPK